MSFEHEKEIRNKKRKKFEIKRIKRRGITEECWGRKEQRNVRRDKHCCDMKSYDEDAHNCLILFIVYAMKAKKKQQQSTQENVIMNYTVT